MGKLLEFFVSLGNLNSVLWISLSLVMSILYGLTKDRSVFYLMICGYISLFVSFFKINFNLQFIVFILIYLALYFGTSFSKKKKEQEKDEV